MILKINDIRFHYNGIDVLKNVCFKVEEGKVTGLIGPNGSGKTTLLKCINGILRPYRGSILFDKKNMKTMSRNDVARNIGYVPQMETGRFPAKVFNTILMGRIPHMNWSPASRDLETVNNVIEQLDIMDIAMKDINQLSGGQKQKVFIGRALAQEPKILLLDEPTANLDVRHELEVMNIIRDLSLHGVTVLISVHDLNLATRYCDNILMLKNGKIFASGGKEILSPKNIRSVYGIDVKVIQDSETKIIVPIST